MVPTICTVKYNLYHLSVKDTVNDLRREEIYSNINIQEFIMGIVNSIKI